MGQTSSTPVNPHSPEELSHRLTNIFAEGCFTPLELYCFKQTFKSLAEDQSGVKYWSKSTFIKFLELPDTLESSDVVYQLCSYLGAFPFSSHAPTVLTGEALLRVVCFMTGRYRKVLLSGEGNLRREIWRGCTSIDGEASATATKLSPPVETNGKTFHEASSQDPTTGSSSAIGEADESKKNEEPKEHGDDQEDELAFHTFELLNALEAFQRDEADMQRATIPNETFTKLLELLLLIAPLGPQENVSIYAMELDGERLEGLHTIANSILSSFGREPGIGYKTFETVISTTLPHLFDSLGPLFEHFLFPKDFDLAKRKDSASGQPSPTSTHDGPDVEAASQVEPAHIPAPEPLLPVQGDILDLSLLSQLSFIFSDNIFHRLRPLYTGHNHGYSMASFEKSVFKWQAPSFLLVSGTLLSPTTKRGNARQFLDDLPHRRLSSSLSSSITSSSFLQSSVGESQDTQRIIYGAYIPVPWQSTHKTAFGSDKTTLFQLSPVHDVFPASSSSQNYIYFNKPPSTYPGLGFGSPLPTYNSMSSSSPSTIRRRSSVTTYSASDTAHSSGSFSDNSLYGPSSPGLARRSSLIADEHIPISPVSLHIDDGLEFGVFTHLSSGGGSFQHSRLPASARTSGGADWQDRFEIDAIEVWGVGDKNVLEEQRRAWLWEEREAERRRTVNLHTGDIEADKELLRLAGLIKDENRSGGSMG